MNYNVSASHTPSDGPIAVSLIVEDLAGDFLAIAEEGLKTVSISSSSIPGILAVTTKVDDPDGVAGTFKVSLVEGTGYALPVSVSASQINANVIDPTIYDVSISSNAITSGVTEGHSFEFTVSTLFNVASNLPISISISDENEDDLNPSLQGGDNSLMIPAGSRTAVGVVTMNLADDAEGVDVTTPGQIKVAVNAVENRYRVIDNSDEILIPVKDADIGSVETPVISISGPTSLIEGETARYNVTANHTPINAPLIVSVLASNTTGNFLATYDNRTHQVPISNSDTPGILEIDTVVDNPDEDAGTITITLVEGTGYALPEDSIDLSVSTVVVDPYGIPELTIDHVETGIFAGFNAMFELTSSTPFEGDLMVVINPVKSGGNFLDESDGPNSEDWSSGENRLVGVTFMHDGMDYKALLSVATVNDSADTDGGTIEVTLKADSNNTATYTVSTTANANSATVTVNKIPEPTLKIISTAVSTDEGTPVEIIIEADENPKLPLTFNYIPTESGTSYLQTITQNDESKATGDTRSATLKFTQNDPDSSDPWRATLNLPIQEADAISGTISVALTTGNGYTVGTPDTSTVTVNDISIPELSIADASRTIGGEDAEFIITSNIPVVGNLNVTYQPVETGTNFLDESDGPSGEDWSSSEDRTVPLNFALDGTVYTATLAVDTTNDDNSPAGGTINLTLQDDSADPITYTVSTTNGANSAQVSLIRAISVPTLTIADTEDVETGGSISLKVTSNATSADTITVRYQASQVRGDYLDETTSPSQAAEQTQDLVFSRSDSEDPFTANLMVDIHDDTTDEDIGTIRVTLKADSEDPATYLVASDGTQDAIATIWDNDGDETIVIGSAEIATEGLDSHINFPVTALVSPNRIVRSVNWYLTESGGDFFRFGREEHQHNYSNLDFTGGKTTTLLPVPIFNDSNRENNSVATVRLITNRFFSYVVDPHGASATGIVTDDDGLPFVNGISSRTTATPESAGSIDFVVSADSAMTKIVYYQTSEVGGGNFLTTEQEKVRSQSLNFAQVNGTGPFVATLNVEFDNDEVGEETGQIKVTLLTKPSGVRNYRIRGVLQLKC